MESYGYALSQFGFNWNRHGEGTKDETQQKKEKSELNILNLPQNTTQSHDRAWDSLPWLTKAHDSLFEVKMTTEKENRQKHFCSMQQNKEMNLLFASTALHVFLHEFTCV